VKPSFQSLQEETVAKAENKIAIAKLLSDGEFHSGEKLGQSLGISRAAVANHVKTLSNLGLDIYSVTGRGYKLANHIELIDQKKINSYANKHYSLETHSIIDSTNEHLMKKIRAEDNLVDGHTVIAECQTEGRGRRGRKWQSPFGSHLYFSQYRVIEDGLSAAAGLSLAVGLAVQRACRKFVNSDVELKWPNDILSNNKKLAGVLIEAEGQSDGKCHLVIGIGINFKMPEQSANEIEQAWTDLESLAGCALDRNNLVSVLLEELETIVSKYKETRLDSFVEEWNDSNAYKEQMVKISSNSLVKSGICKGIDNTGALILENIDSGKLEKIFGGEISLRKL